MRTGVLEAQESRRAAAQPRQGWPSWIVMKGSRLLILTLLWTGLGMGVGLLTGIVALMTLAVVHHGMPQMSLAYRRFAIPTAILSGSCALLWNVVRTLQAALRRLSDGSKADSD